jgi:hypothetical protein
MKSKTTDVAGEKQLRCRRGSQLTCWLTAIAFLNLRDPHSTLVNMWLARWAISLLWHHGHILGWV